MMNRAMKREARRAARRQPRPPRDYTGGLRSALRSCEMDPDVACTTLAKVHDAFARLRTGETDDDIYHRLASAINVGLVRAEQIDELLVPPMLAACEALEECCRIRQAHGRYGFTGPGLAAVADAIDTYEAILRASSSNQMTAAMHIVLERTNAQLAALGAAA